MGDQGGGSGLEYHPFDWALFDRQPRKIKEVTWYAVASGVHLAMLIPPDMADYVIRRGQRIIAEKKAAAAFAAYGPDHPDAQGYVPPPPVEVFEPPPEKPAKKAKKAKGDTKLAADQDDGRAKPPKRQPAKRKSQSE
jgi:hypothetical protein